MRTVIHVAWLGTLLLCLSGSLWAGETPPRGATTPLGPPLECTADFRDQVATQPFSIPSPPVFVPPLLGRLEGYVLTDSIETSLFVTPGDEYCVRFDHQALSLGDTLLPYELTPTARAAIEIAPTWLQMDMEQNLRRLSDADQDVLGNLLLALPDPRTIDEVAFQIAHLSRMVFTYWLFDPELLRVNAELMYQIDPELQFVEIVDHDLGDGNFYSTTCYRTIVEGDTVTVEIPYEMYYWWIVMPKISDEPPLMAPLVYDMFWREYLYYEHDPSYPLLQDVMQPITVLWDGEPHDWPGARAFTDSMLAVDAVGNWVSETVPYQASGDRPIQPNQIAHGHNGNCGELQDLLCAAARTCLIPALCTMDILEDHVWCEVWLDECHPYQVSWRRGGTYIDNPVIAGDVDHGGGKDVSCVWDWRNDGYTWDVVARYSNACTLTVYIDDPNGVPLDNASVIISSEFYYDPYPIYNGTWGETGQDGAIRFLLGDNQNYYARVTTSLGNCSNVSIISGSVAGEHYYWNWTTSGEMTQLEMTEGTPGTDAEYVIEVEYDLPCDVQTGRDYYATPIDFYAEKLAEGHLDFFIADGPNFEAYRSREPFVGYMIAEGASVNHVYFHLPSIEDYFVVLSGAEHHGFLTQANVKIRLWSIQTAVAQTPDVAPTGTSLLQPFPNPFNPKTTLTFAVAEEGPVSLAIYDVRGALIRHLVDESLPSGLYERVWDGRDDSGHLVASSVYLARMEGRGTTQSRKLVMLK